MAPGACASPAAGAAGLAAAAAAPTAAAAPPPRRSKLLLLIIDGVGDVTVPAFGDRTPLQVAHTPNLDAVAGAVACSIGYLSK